MKKTTEKEMMVLPIQKEPKEDAELAKFQIREMRNSLPKTTPELELLRNVCLKRKLYSIASLETALGAETLNIERIEESVRCYSVSADASVEEFESLVVESYDFVETTLNRWFPSQGGQMAV